MDRFSTEISEAEAALRKKQSRAAQQWELFVVETGRLLSDLFEEQTRTSVLLQGASKHTDQQLRALKRDVQQLRENSLTVAHEVLGPYQRGAGREFIAGIQQMMTFSSIGTPKMLIGPLNLAASRLAAILENHGFRSAGFSQITFPDRMQTALHDCRDAHIDAAEQISHVADLKAREEYRRSEARWDAL
jgi:hypothetical protein